MTSFRNQENNWAYIFILLVITAVAATTILISAQNTIKEINSLSPEMRLGR